MKKTWIGCLMLAAVFSTNAQLTISVQLPPAGLIQKDQLWNLVVVNNGENAIDAVVLLNLQEEVSGQTVLTAVTGSLLLAKGVKLVSFQDVQPVQYNYYSAGMSGSYLPLGTYIACYRITKNMGENPEVMAEECVRLNINPLSPPLLIMPVNESVVETGYPQFTWMPPAPIDMFSNLNYDLLLTEVLEGQSPSEALLYNNPVYINNNLSQAFDNYPSSYAQLDTAKLYAWQVTARNGMNYAAQTEVYTFNVRSPGFGEAAPAGISYIVLKRNGEGIGLNYVKGESVYIKYYSFQGDRETPVRILSTDGKLQQESIQSTRYGNNFIRIELDRSLKKGTTYRVEITDQQQVVHKAVFIIQ